MPDREKVVDGLERLRFFNQRAGRELWSAKPHDVQEIDISDADAVFADALELLKEHGAKTGHWIYKKYDDMFMCSCCEKYSIRNDYPYCHWCGAKMEQKDGDGE